jgi:hypothetical protein
MAMGSASRFLGILSIASVTPDAAIAGLTDWAPAIPSLPPVTYRVGALSVPLSSAYDHRAPMLERLLAKPIGSARRGRSATWAIGDVAISAEASRLRAVRDPFFRDGSTWTRTRQWAFGLRSDWSLGREDTLSFGLAQAKEHRSEPFLLAGRPHISNTLYLLDAAWTHANWQLSGGWSRDSGSRATIGAERLAQLAAGAALHEQGFHFAIARQIATGSSRLTPTIGLDAQDMTLLADDSLALGTAGIRDRQARLFLRLGF